MDIFLREKTHGIIIVRKYIISKVNQKTLNIYNDNMSKNLLKLFQEIYNCEL